MAVRPVFDLFTVEYKFCEVNKMCSKFYWFAPEMNYKNVEKALMALNSLDIDCNQRCSSRVRGAAQMQKVVFNELALEVTRRCNMACDHCLRGDAQDADLSTMDIDNILDQTEAIGKLILTGGEPTMNMKALQYIANGITQRGIPVMRVEIISNGLVYDERLVAVMKRFGEITRLTAEQGYNKSHWGPWCALLGISLDRHHESGKVCAANYKRYKEVLAGHAEVLRISHGNDYIRAGRAVDLPGGQDISFFTSSYMAQRVEVLDFEHKPMCKFYQSYHLARADQKVICCALYVTALGDVSPTWACNAEYDSWEVRLCHTWESVWDAILRYNDEYNLHPCTYCEDLRIKYVFMDAVLNNGGKLANKPILDEQSAETFDEDEERRLQQLYEASCQEPDMAEEIERRARERNYLTVKGVQLQ